MVMSFMSDDQWETATLTDSYSTGSVFPTTATSERKNVYVLYAFLNRRNAGHSAFRIQELPLKNRPF